MTSPLANFTAATTPRNLGGGFYEIPVVSAYDSGLVARGYDLVVLGNRGKLRLYTAKLALELRTRVEAALRGHARSIEFGMTDLHALVLASEETRDARDADFTDGAQEQEPAEIIAERRDAEWEPGQLDLPGMGRR